MKGNTKQAKGKTMKTKTISIPEFEDCAFKLECLPEDTPIRGNCSAIDEETDAATEKWITDQLEAGNEWAWCIVRVTCYYDAGLHGITGTDYLGGCSYDSEADFAKEGGYFEDMKRQAYDDFVRKVEAL